MNTSILAPENNFYEYVNNEWILDPKNQIPDDYSCWGGFTKLFDEGLNNQINMVKELDNNCKTEEEIKISSMWRASQKIFSDWEEGDSDYNPIKNELEILDDHFKTKNENYIKCFAKYAHYTHVNGIPNLIIFDKDSDLKNVNNVVLDLNVGGLSLPSREYYKSKDFEDKLLLFKEHLTNIKVILEKVGINLDANFVENILEFEDKIANFKMKPEQSREYNTYYTNTTLENIYLEMNNLNSLDKKQENYEENDRDFKLSDEMINKASELFENMYEHYNFRKILEDNFIKNFSNTDDSPNKYHITAYDGDAIRRCMDLILDESNFDKYRSYMQYKIIHNYYSYCSKELDNEFFDFYGKKIGGQEKPKANEKRSINIVNDFAGEMMGKLFVSKYFTSTSKNNMENLVNNILSTMQESLKNNDWLTEETKNKALNKLSTFRSKIGYPDVWKDYSDFDVKLGDSLYEISKKATKWNLRVNFFEKINSILDREEWRMNPQTVNAYFMPTQNEIVFPAAILQPPFFHKSKETIDFNIKEEMDMVDDLDTLTPTNYGAIGAIIAHEITHGYDDQGRKFDLNGNLNDWWNEKDCDLFQKKTELLTNSVSKYLYIDEKTKKEHRMNAKLTMGENLADIGGLSLSVKALLTKLKNENASPLSVKASLRILFKSYANVFKLNIKPERVIMLLNMDPHAPTTFRGNLVQHIDEFYEVFNVKDTDNMYLDPKDRMKMW